MKSLRMRYNRTGSICGKADDDFNLYRILFLDFLCLVWTTDTALAGQCKSGQIYKEMTLKGGINAGTYKDVGGVSTMEECQKKCCEFNACDLAFMLAGMSSFDSLKLRLERLPIRGVFILKQNKFIFIII